MAGKVKFIIIKTREQGIFISDNVEGASYFNSQIPHLLFDDQLLVATFKKDWYKLGQIPQKIEKKGADKRDNQRYELKSGFPISELTPACIPWGDFDNESEIAGLYSYKFDNIEGVWESIDFEIELLSEEDNFYTEKPKYPSTPSLITSLSVDPALHTERPCSISGKELYRIIRNHIKLNIDSKYASISSDYDFCLCVVKVISHEPVSYTVDVGTKRRPRLETRYRKSRTVKVFETSPEGYSNYPKQPPINGDNQKDLENKIEEYLENLMEKINKPYVECSHCNGMGVKLE